MSQPQIGSLMKSVDDRARAALWYAEKKKWPVLCLHTIKGGKCTCHKGADCESPGKHPRYDKKLLPHGPLSYTTEPKLIAAWWTKWPGSNVGIATGEHSFDALDVDLPEGPKPFVTSSKRMGRCPIPSNRLPGRGPSNPFPVPRRKAQERCLFRQWP